MPKRSRLVAAAACTTLLAAAAPASAATTWTQVASGTTQDITAVEYRGDTQAWLATGGGQLLSADGGGGFVVRRTFPGESFTDISFDPSGTHGLATTATGGLYRSADGGTNWAPIVLVPVRRSCTDGTATAVPRLNAAFWADGSIAYAVGGSASTEPIVLRSTNRGLSWSDANWAAPGCRLGVAGTPVTDGLAIPGNPNALRFITESFGAVYSTNDGLATTAIKTGEMITNFDDVPRMAIDAANPSRMWAVDHNGAGCGSLCFTFSETGGASDAPMTIVGSPAGIRRNLYGVSYAGGTLVAAGDGGEIYTSVDGKNAYLQRAGTPLEGVNWRSVSIADAGRAMVGGAGGVLVRTANANSLPDMTAPTATISGPATLRVGEPGTYTASVADEAGGSGVDPASLAWSSPGTPGASGPSAAFTFTTTGPRTITLTFKDLAGNAGRATFAVNVTSAGTTPPPARRPTGRTPGRNPGGAGTPPNVSGRAVTTTTGGATIATWKKVALSRGRFVPVRISARSPRRFVIEIRRAKKPRTRIAMAKTSLRRGKKLVKVPLRRSTKTGKYLIVVRVYKGRRAIGKRVRTAFVIVR
jgi:photosystem II stability/assembly factor-like uncharacterized protein